MEFYKETTYPLDTIDALRNVTSFMLLVVQVMDAKILLFDQFAHGVKKV